MRVPKMVAWGGIEPPTRGFSMCCPRAQRFELTRYSQQNQALTTHWLAVVRSQSHAFVLVRTRHCH
jgi:hypothetical protein